MLSTETHLNFITDAGFADGSQIPIQTETFFMFLAVVKKKAAATRFYRPGALSIIVGSVLSFLRSCDIYERRQQRLAFSVR